MEKRLVPWIKGIAAAVAAMLIYAVPLGLMTALVLLVAAMEEGSNVLSAQTVPLSKAVILLSEGVGFQGGSIVMGVTPLLLTILLIALIRTVCTKTSTDPRAFVSGAVVWLLLQHVLMSGLHVRLEDSTGVVMGKALLIYTLGYLLAAVPHMPLLGVTKNYIRRYASAPVRHSIRVGVRTALILLAGVALVGLGTVIVWITLGHHQMSAWFDALHMQTGSRVLMCVIGLAWLPNVCLWAISWLFGAGFSIGEAANYTLWLSTTQDLPPLPLFALFPQAIDHDALRTAVMLIPLGLGIAVGLSMLFARSGFHIRLKQGSLDMRSLLMDFAYPAGAFCISAAVLSIVNAIVFPLANGSLGSHRLAHVGVDVRQATNAVARPCSIGLFIAWGAVLVITAVVFTVRWGMARHAADSHSSSAKPLGEDQVTEKPESTHRVVNSTPQKEKQGDDEPTATTGLGVRIP